MVINGYVRDIEILKTLDIGVQALGTMPVRSKKKNQGELGVDITFGGVTFLEVIIFMLIIMDFFSVKKS